MLMLRLDRADWPRRRNHTGVVLGTQHRSQHGLSLERSCPAPQKKHRCGVALGPQPLACALLLATSRLAFLSCVPCVLYRVQLQRSQPEPFAEVLPASKRQDVSLRVATRKEVGHGCVHARTGLLKGCSGAVCVRLATSAMVVGRVLDLHARAAHQHASLPGYA